MAILALINSLLRPPKPYSTSVLFLARAVQGEGAGFFSNRQEVGLWIAHIALNRYEDRESNPWWHHRSIQEIVEDAFHGYVNVKDPDPWAVRIVWKAVGRKEDITGGALFMLSKNDMERLQVTAVPLQAFEEGPWGLYFFKTWPVRNE